MLIFTFLLSGWIGAEKLKTWRVLFAMYAHDDVSNTSVVTVLNQEVELCGEYRLTESFTQWDLPVWSEEILALLKRCSTNK